MDQAAAAIPLLSVVVPVRNEAAGIALFDARLRAAIAHLPVAREIIYVDDGSTDATAAALARLRQTHPDIALLTLSRNFGKEIALAAGLDHAQGDAVVIIDADLQDPPELIPDLVAKWREGYDNVYGQRLSRAGESWLKRTTAHAFYRVLNRVSDHPIPMDTGDFRLLSRRTVEALATLREQHRFMKGLYAWVGFRSVAVPYHRAPRAAGRTNWNYWKLWNFSLEGITSFSTLPLRLVSYVGLATALLAVLYASYMVVKTLIFGNPVAGYPSLIVIVLFLGGVQLLSVGILGEYVGRLFNEAKRRPLYFVAAFTPAATADAAHAPTHPAAR